MSIRLLIPAVAALATILAAHRIATADDEPLTAETAAECYARGDWAGAAHQYSALAQREPEKGQYHYRLGFCRLSLGKPREALAGFEEAIKRGSPEGPVRYAMARAHARLGDKDAALTCLTKSAEMGFARSEAIAKEEDFAPLRSEARFTAAVRKIDHPTEGLKGADAMDHWVGEWDVFVNGQRVGENRIAKTLRGFGVEESWNGGSGRGRSLFVFVAAKGQWKQLWTSDTGWVVEKIGAPIENGIYLEGTSTFADGKVKKSREYLTRNADGSVRQLLEDWDEEAKQWKPTFDGKYVRKETKKD